MKRLLVIAYHFPPLVGSSGIQRTLRFAQHLPTFGWEVVVLTCHPRAYEKTETGAQSERLPAVHVESAFALDTARHLAVAGKYPEWLARPDRWVSWWPGAVFAGRRMVRKYQPAAIFSTYPIATAHLVGHSLAKASGLPWVADFRDPMAHDGYPADPRTLQSFERIEKRVFARAAACTFTTPSALALYRNRFPTSSAHLELIENGYDEEAFAEAGDEARTDERLHGSALTLLHSGIVYPGERDPTQLFVALSELKARGIGASRLRVRFRAPVSDDLLHRLAMQYHVEDMIEVEAHIPYRDALREMLRADGLLLIQAANCNAQVPAKLYEYLRARRPVLALTDSQGDTADVLRSSGIEAIANLARATEIVDLLQRFVSGDRTGMLVSEKAVVRGSRRNRAEQLAGLLDRLPSRGIE